MTDFEDRVRRALEQSTRAVAEAPDWDDLTDRLTKRDRTRTRWLAFALVLALFAGPLAGFALGRRGAGDDTNAVRAVDDRARDDGVVVGDSGPVPTIATVPQDLDGSATEALAPELDGWQQIDVYHPLYLSSEPISFLFARDVDDLRIRVYRAATPGGPYGPPWWDPPGWCFPTGFVQADVSTDAAVGFASGSTYDALRDGDLVARLSWIGIAEGEPAWVIVVQAPSDATSVRASLAGGASDSMEPVEGIAVLYGRATKGTPAEELYDAVVNVEALDVNGTVIASSPATNHFSDWSGASSDECVPPADLPEPGAEQPADPAAARAEIAQLFGRAWSETTIDDKLALLDDSRNMRQVYEELENGPFAAAVRSARSTLDEVVFLSATRAAVQFDTHLDGYPESAYANQLGEVVFVDGQWKNSRETFCRQVQAAGVTCPPPE